MSSVERQGDAKAFADDNHLFHALIYAGSHNRVLEEMAIALRRRLSPFRRAHFSLKVGRHDPSPSMMPWSRQSFAEIPPPPTPRCCIM